jgi:hypothetical protein
MIFVLFNQIFLKIVELFFTKHRRITDRIICWKIKISRDFIGNVSTQDLRTASICRVGWAKSKPTIPATMLLDVPSFFPNPLMLRQQS